MNDAVEILKEMRDDVTVNLYDTLHKLIGKLSSPIDGRFVGHADVLWREYRSLLETKATYDAAIEKLEEKYESE
jgi:hypothetical protein